jgi:LuxR family maltose regulon positive regulatory protein
LEAAVAVVRDMGYTADLPVWIESRITAWQARMYVARGRDEPAYLDAAASLLAERGVSAGDEPPYLRESAYLALARLLLARERWDAAGALLDRLARAAEAGERQGRVVEVMVLRALALDARGSRGPALDLLARAVIRARPEGYVRLFVDEGEPLAQLLYAAVDRDVVAAEAGRLLAAFPVPASGDGLRKTAPELVEPLTDRELEVLALIDTGATNQEIAQELVISVYTVKKHVSNLLGKLEVDNRREAARRARAIGLLPSLPR